jgi:hypothetical protein
MTLKKLVMIGALLVTALGAGVSQAKADVLHANVGPARVHYVQRAPHAEWRGRPGYYRRPVVNAPVIHHGYGYGHAYHAANRREIRDQRSRLRYRY